MEKREQTEIPWQGELLDYVDDSFEKQVLNIAIDEFNPEGILRRVKELIREKLYEDQKPEN